MGKSSFKVLIAAVSWPPETFLQRLFRGLAEAGIDVTVACPQKPEGAWMAHGNIHWLQIFEWNMSIISRLLFLAKSFVAALIKGPGDIRWIGRYASPTRGMVERLYLYFKFLPFAGRRWDVIYFPWNSAAIEFLPLFDYCPAVVSCRGSQINIAPHDPNRKEMSEQLRTTFERAAAVHCVSEAIKNEAGRYGLDPAKATVIHPAVDPDFFCPGARLQGQHSIFRIVTVGSLTWPKGYEYALLALRRLLDHRVAAELHVIGDGPERARLLYTIDDLNLEERVHLHGRLSPAEVRSQLQQADAFLLSSFSEGISNAVLEAMACGLPVVTTDCGGMREAVTDEVEGLLVPMRDPEAMAAALHRLASGQDLCHSMGKAARQRIVQDFKLLQQIEAFKSLFMSLARENPGQAGKP
jgi:colanic acid/amylovoran biosynthesis glycosyltransferase